MTVRVVPQCPAVLPKDRRVPREWEGGRCEKDEGHDGWHRAGRFEWTRPQR